jgi:hypothetical protein
VEREAQTRPPAKRYIDESIIEKYLREKDEKDKRAEEAKTRAMQELSKTVKLTLDEQVRKD